MPVARGYGHGSNRASFRSEWPPCNRLFLQQVLNGLLAGAYYLLIALGLSLIFSLGGIVNLAHGAFYAIGAYLTVVLVPDDRLRRVDRRLAGAGRACSAWSSSAYSSAASTRSDPMLSLLLTFGLAMVAEQALRMIFGAPPLSYSIPQELRGQIFIGDFVYPYYRALLLAVAVGLRRRPLVPAAADAFGRVVRAGVQNPDMVGALGISLEPYMAAVALPRRRARGPGRRHAGADLRDPPGHGRRRSSRRPSSWSSSAGSARSGASWWLR